jgi:hypothetical protein
MDKKRIAVIERGPAGTAFFHPSRAGIIRAAALSLL